MKESNTNISSYFLIFVLGLLNLVMIHLITFGFTIGDSKISYKSLLSKESTFELWTLKRQVKYMRTLRGYKTILYLKDDVAKQKKKTIYFSSLELQSYFKNRGFRSK